MRVTLRTTDRLVRSRLLAALAGGAVVAAGLGGCAAGQRAATANEFSVVDGISANVGAMGIRDAGVTAPKAAAGYVAGSTATLSMTVVNVGSSPDALTSVSTPNAASAKITPAPSSAAPASASTSAGQIVVPANGAVVVGPGTGSAVVSLSGLKYRLVPGQSIPVTLNFKIAGPVTVDLAVKLVPDQTGGPTADVVPTTPPAN
jgi:copper(I)-binding protein